MKKVNKVTFRKTGNGSITTQVSIPKSWLEGLGVNQENKEVEIEYTGKEIIIRNADKNKNEILEALDEVGKVSDRMLAEFIKEQMEFYKRNNN